MSARASLAEAADGDRVLFRCPGCDDNHQIRVGTWSWNGDVELPTFSPSLLVGGVQWDPVAYPEMHKPNHPDVEPGKQITCHSFITDGQIKFLGDCTHALAGQTVDLPEWKP